jgi:3'-5' exoribonuclease
MENNSQKNIRSAAVGDFLSGFFALRRFERRDWKGKPFLTIELGDSSGRIRGSYWGDDSAALCDALTNTQIVYVCGTVGEYKEELDLKISAIRPAEKSECNAEELLPKADINIEEIARKLDNLISAISEKYISELLSNIFNETEFRKGFLKAPAGKLWHGAYIGGLAEHTINVAEICDFVSKKFPVCRRDLLVAGALLHDIGKVEEFSIGSSFDYTPEGRLIGHLVLGERKIREASFRIDGFPTGLRDELSHIVLSHHGEFEMGSPILPTTIEAILVHSADMLEANGNAFSHIIEKELPDGKTFSNWVKPIDRFLYLEGYRGAKALD